MTPEEAKQRSHDFLAQHKLRINDTLPFIESPQELQPQSPDDVARRAIVLGHIIGIGFGQPGAKMKAPLEEFGLFRYTSANETRLLNANTYTEQEKVNATWLVECMQALGWCLGLVNLDPFAGCDDNLASHFPRPFTDPSDFIANAKLRPFPELYQQADLHYRLHWLARDARLNGYDSPVKEGVIQERRKAIDWVVGVEADWDEMPMDT
ncbi:MAG: DUF4272 domain-containing protein [Planctomycetota bacterium]